MQRADVGMVQRRGQTSLTLESLGEVLGRDFYRYFAMQSRVRSTIHFAHAALTKQPFDFVMSQPRTGLEGHGFMIAELACIRVHSRPKKVSSEMDAHARESDQFLVSNNVS